MMYKENFGKIVVGRNCEEDSKDRFLQLFFIKPVMKIQAIRFVNYIIHAKNVIKIGQNW